MSSQKAAMPGQRGASIRRPLVGLGLLIAVGFLVWFVLEPIICPPELRVNGKAWAEAVEVVAKQANPNILVIKTAQKKGAALSLLIGDSQQLTLDIKFPKGDATLLPTVRNIRRAFGRSDAIDLTLARPELRDGYIWSEIGPNNSSNRSVSGGLKREDGSPQADAASSTLLVNEFELTLSPNAAVDATWMKDEDFKKKLADEFAGDRFETAVNKLRDALTLLEQYGIVESDLQQLTTSEQLVNYLDKKRAFPIREKVSGPAFLYHRNYFITSLRTALWTGPVDGPQLLLNAEGSERWKIYRRYPKKTEWLDQARTFDSATLQPLQWDAYYRILNNTLPHNPPEGSEVFRLYGLLLAQDQKSLLPLFAELDKLAPDVLSTTVKSRAKELKESASYQGTYEYCYLGLCLGHLLEQLPDKNRPCGGALRTALVELSKELMAAVRDDGSVRRLTKDAELGDRSVTIEVYYTLCKLSLVNWDGEQRILMNIEADVDQSLKKMSAYLLDGIAELKGSDHPATWYQAPNPKDPHFYLDAGIGMAAFRKLESTSIESQLKRSLVVEHLNDTSFYPMYRLLFLIRLLDITEHSQLTVTELPDKFEALILEWIFKNIDVQSAVLQAQLAANSTIDSKNATADLRIWFLRVCLHQMVNYLNRTHPPS